MKISYWLLATFCLAMFSGCGGNRYYKNYNGERFSKTKWCNLISAEVEYYNTGKTLDEQIRQLQSEGYRVIGFGENDAVVKCDAVGFGSTQCAGSKLNAKNRRRVNKTCQAVGGDVALYDSQRILYLRNMKPQVENEFSGKGDEGEDFHECASRSNYIKPTLLCKKSFFHAKGFYWNPIEEKCELFQGRTETVKEICALGDESSRPSD